ncbi:MAG: alpha/beta hydrolase [Candidatus Aminicenantes bacterium]|nr:alpha/beta hydrolase [Candidatus Aminicenantes bacterium]
MENIRKYGKAPFNIAVIHGGPGAPGEMAAVAKELSKTCGVLEPLQTKSSLKEQLQELEIVLKENGGLPMTLIGFSWGAWLSFVFAARNSSFVQKLILVSSGPFEERYALDIMRTRLSRLAEEERMTIDSLSEILNDPERQDKNEIFAQLGELISKADSYDPLPYKSDVIEYQYYIFENVWKEAEELRRSGKLVALGKKIRCPVVAIHGDCDAHSAEGVKIPLASVIKNFRFILLKNCGHRPWIERAAKDAFYTILKKEL